MKKQLLIAAVAATMTSAAIADISITGGMKVNYKDTDNNGALTNAISHETDLQITGKSGGTTVYIELNNDSADGLAGTTSSTTTAGTDSTEDNGNFDVEDVWMKTSIAGATVKAGTWNGSDSLVSADSARALGKFEVSTTVSGVTVIADGSSDANKNITFKGDVAGVAASYKIDDEGADEYKLSTTMNGVTVAYHNVDDSDSTANTGKSSIMVSGSYQGFDLAYAQADTDTSASITGDSFFGDMAAVERTSGGSASDGMASGDDVSGFSIKTNVAGNALKARFVTIDATTAALDSDIMTLTATRALASGVTVEATYTDEDSTTAANDKEVLDLELAVKF
jgi:hypothetical protein